MEDRKLDLRGISKPPVTSIHQNGQHHSTRKSRQTGIDDQTRPIYGTRFPITTTTAPGKTNRREELPATTSGLNTQLRIEVDFEFALGVMWVLMPGVRCSLFLHPDGDCKAGRFSPHYRWPTWQQRQRPTKQRGQRIPRLAKSTILATDRNRSGLQHRKIWRREGRSYRPSSGLPLVTFR